MDDLTWLRKGDLICVEGNTLISKLIRFFDRAKYTHVAIYIGDGLVIESDWGGVQTNPLLEKYQKLSWDAFRPKCLYKTKDKAIDFALEQEGKGYDYHGLIGALLKGLFLTNMLDHKNRFWCSELVADAYIEAGYPLTKDLNSWDVSPQDLADSYRVKKVKYDIKQR
ncbi:MAG: YiiX/YebB-like N1pC/P60 family cysteine hydrolase [Candidatus Hodarchaeales archaeon]